MHDDATKPIPTAPMLESEVLPDDRSSDAGITLDIFCPACGYNLRGLTGRRCPECGKVIDYAHAKDSLIPWVKREDIGGWRAYLLTLRLVMFRQREFSAEMARDVDEREAQRFRWAMLVAGYLPIAALLTYLNFFAPWMRATPPFGWLAYKLPQDLRPTVADPYWLAFVSYAGLPLTLVLASKIPSNFFQIRDLSDEARSRASALTCYALGPLGLFGLPAVCIFAGSLNQFDGLLPLGLLLFGLITPFMLLTVWWLDAIHLARKLTPHLPRRPMVVCVGLPLVSAGLLGIFVVLPTLAYSVAR